MVINSTICSILHKEGVEDVMASFIIHWQEFRDSCTCLAIMDEQGEDLSLMPANHVLSNL